MKDRVEVWINKQVCAGRISLEEAQRQIAENWTLLYRQMVGEK